MFDFLLSLLLSLCCFQVHFLLVTTFGPSICFPALERVLNSVLSSCHSVSTFSPSIHPSILWVSWMAKVQTLIPLCVCKFVSVVGIYVCILWDCAAQQSVSTVFLTHYELQSLSQIRGMLKDDTMLKHFDRSITLFVSLCIFVCPCACVMNGPVPGNVPSVALDQSAYLLAASTASD